AQAFDIKFRRGAVVSQVEADSPADRAGLRVGDIVTEVNGKPVRDASTLRNSIGLLRVGQEVHLKVLREGKTKSLVAKVEEPSWTEQGGERMHAELTGAVLANLDDASRGRAKGVLIAAVDPGSPAWRNGLRKGDIIVSVNRQAVESVEQLQKAVNGSQTLLLNIRRGNGALFLYLK
ncbi:MAG: PDZ domain-containing protein, partial [Halobacteria archaeon]|nr:PDZ domain-containing protein [Halobacteria archaeon]